MIRLFSKLKNAGTFPNPIYKRPAYQFSQVDRFLNQLSKPLYYYVIGANLGVFLLWNLPMVDKNFMYNNFTLSGRGLQEGRIHTILTHAFSQYAFMHLAFNMLTFYFFGRAVEFTFGSKRLLMVYMAGILGGVCFSNLSSGIPHLGASAAINAILTYYICNFPNTMMFFFMIPVPAWAVGLILLYQSWMTGQQGSGGHLGGMIAGSACYFFFRGRL